MFKPSINTRGAMRHLITALLALVLLAISQNQLQFPVNVQQAQAQAPLKVGVRGGAPQSAEAAQRVVLDQLPSVAESYEPSQQIPRPRTGVSPEIERLRKQQATAGAAAPRLPASGALSEATTAESRPDTPWPTNRFKGMSSGLSPSDMALAVGRSYVVQIINSKIAVYDKSGNLQPGYPKSLHDFLSLRRKNTDLLFDPRAIYDRQHKRYVAVITQDRGTQASSSFWLAISQTPDPRGSWFIYNFVYSSDNDDFGDYPTLGQDEQGIYIGFNTFSNATVAFKTNTLWLFPKSQVLNGSAVNYWVVKGLNVNGSDVDTLQPANSFGSPRAEFVVNSFNINFGGGQCSRGCNGLAVWAVSNPFGFINGGPSPEVSGVVLPTSEYSLPPPANAPGCAGCVDTLDTRLSGSVNYNAGSLFAVLATAVNKGSTTVAGLRWFEIGMVLNDNDNARCNGTFLNQCPQITSAYLKQEGTHYYGGDRSAFYGTIQPDTENNLVMVYNTSSSSLLPTTAFTSRRATFTPNLFHDAGQLLASGTGSVTHDVRWGDYTGTALDPRGKRKMWFSGMVNHVTNDYRTVIGSAGYLSPNQP